LVGRSTSVSGLLAPRAGRLINQSTARTQTCVRQHTKNECGHNDEVERVPLPPAVLLAKIVASDSSPPVSAWVDRRAGAGSRRPTRDCVCKHSLTLSVVSLTSSLCWGSAFACPHRVNTRTCSSHASAMQVVWRINDCNHELSEIAGEKRGAPQATSSAAKTNAARTSRRWGESKTLFSKFATCRTPRCAPHTNWVTEISKHGRPSHGCGHGSCAWRIWPRWTQR